jgi:phosphoglycerate dehydrogenase-like enzyme
MKFLSNINLSKNQLQNAVIQPLANDPLEPVVGQIYFDSTTAVLKIYRKIGDDAAFWGTVGVTNLTLGTVTTTNVPILSSAGTGITSLPAAEATKAGILTATTQTIGGAKTFADGVITGSGEQT